jgi:hypothetical protein
MGCKSMLVGRLMGVGMRRLHGVQDTLGPWVLRSVLPGSYYKEEMDASMVYGSSMLILQDENGGAWLRSCEERLHAWRSRQRVPFLTSDESLDRRT